MLVLGIDPGTVIMGYGLVEHSVDTLRMVDSGVIQVGLPLPIERRLKELYAGICRVIEDHSPDEVAIEEPFVSDNKRTALAIGRAQAVAVLSAANHGLPVSYYSPAKIKKMVCNSGAGSKEQVQEMVKLHLGLTDVPSPADAADALAVAICHIQQRIIDNLTGID